jgi:hypothetical protein
VGFAGTAQQRKSPTPALPEVRREKVSASPKSFSDNSDERCHRDSIRRFVSRRRIDYDGDRIPMMDDRMPAALSRLAHFLLAAAFLCFALASAVAAAEG